MKYVCVSICFFHGSFEDETQLEFHYFLVLGFLSVLLFSGKSFAENGIINLLVERSIVLFFSWRSVFKQSQL